MRLHVKLERKKNAVKNIKYGIVNKIITILCPFVLRTVLIHTLGTEYLGLSSLFTAILQVLSLSELGMGSAMVFSLYQPIAQDDGERIKNLLAVYKYIYWTIGSVILVLGIACIPFLHYLIQGELPAGVNIYVLFVIYLINTVESYFISAYKSTVLSAYQRRDVLSNIGSALKVLLYAIQILLLFATRNYYAYVICLPVFTALENIATAVYVNRKYGHLYDGRKGERGEIRKLFSRVGDLFGHRLENVVINTADTITLSAFLGLNVVTVYNNYYYIMSAISGVFDIIYQGILAGIGNSLTIESSQKNLRDFKLFTLMNGWMVGFSSICFLCLYQPMMGIWMGPELMLPFSMVILFSLYFYVWKIRQSVLIYKDAAGMWKADRQKPYIEILLNLILDLILVKLMGIPGVVIATIISMLFVALPWETKVFMQQMFPGHFRKYMITQVEYFVLTCLLGAETYALCSMAAGGGIVELVLKTVICIAVPNGTLYLLFRKKPLFQEALGILFNYTTRSSKKD